MPFRLVVRNLLAHPLRSLLTFGSVFVAVLLLCMLTGATRALGASVENAATNRLVVQSAVSLYVDLPLSYGAKIEAVDGVDWTCRWQWFGGIYQDRSNFFAQFGIDPAVFEKSYPEIRVVEGSFEAFAANRTGCLIGADLAAKYGWKLGDRVPLKGTIFPRTDGKPWEFTVEAIYRSSSPTIDQQTLYFDFDYLHESVEAGSCGGPDGVGVYMVRIHDGADVTQIMADIDLLFANGPQRVQATTEGEFQRQFVSMLGNVPTLLGMIGGAILFAIFFAVLNTMMMAARERTRDIGIMKALGFGDRAILMTLATEGLLLCGSAGLLAVAAVKGMSGQIARSLVGMGIPGFEVESATAATGLGIALLIGLIAGGVPGWLASRLAPVRALRMEV